MCVEAATICVGSLKDRHFGLGLCETHSLALYFRIQLEVGAILRFICNNFVLCRYNSYFDRVAICLHSYCLLHIVVSLLFTPEALHFVLLHGVLLVTQLGNGLNESYHSFITLAIELFVIAGFKLYEFSGTVLKRIFRDRWFYGIFIVCEESLAIV